MTLSLAALLGVQAVVFLVWIILAFRWLLALRADAVARSGTTLPGLGHSLHAFRAGLSDPRYASIRLRLGLVTLVLLASSIFAARLM